MIRRSLDKPILFTTVLLIAMGFAALYSAGQTDVPSAVTDIWRRQLVWLVAGVIAAVIVFRVSPRLLEWVAPIVYGFSLFLLVMTLVVGVGAGTAAGTRSWIAIGGIRLGQPAELAKLATILMLARHLGGRRHPPAGLWEAAPAGLIVGVPFLLVGLQPDLGSAIVFVAILFGALFWAGVNPALLLLLASPLISLMLAFSTVSWGAWIVFITIFVIWTRPYLLDGLTVWFSNAVMGLVALGLWDQLKPYQQNRLLSFLNPEIDPRATGWHIIQSKIAIGSGGLLGKGFTEGTQKRLAFLPAQHTDFVFSVVGEEAGFIGVLFALVIYAVLISILIRVAHKANDPFSGILVFGVVSLLITHIVVNIGMTVGVMPITGIPLPFFSYGGSFLVTCCVAIGLALRVAWDSQLAGYLNA
ncbi:MAG: rod shape-determining protein RodA [Gemmatimonadales bacterium]